MLHIGLLIYGSLETISGGYLYDRKLVDYLRGRGEQVTILSLPWRNYARHVLDNFSAGLERSLVESPFDILVQDELNHPSLFLLNRKIKPRLPYPVISLVHHLRSSEVSPAWQKKIYAWVERKYLASVDGFVCNSRATEAAVCSLAQSIRHLPAVVAHPAGDRFNPSLDEAELRSRVFQQGPLRLLFVGNLIPRKGFHNLLEALTRIPKESWHLTAIGRTDLSRGYLAAVRAKIEAYGLQDRVQLLGALGDEALKQHLASSHVLTVPSSYEGFGIVYLEAMGFGLPVIAGAAGGAGEFITDGKEGFLVNPHDVPGLARKIMDLIQNRVVLFTMGMNAIRRYQGHPTWEQSMQRVHGFLAQMAHQRERLG